MGIDGRRAGTGPSDRTVAVVDAFGERHRWAELAVAFWRRYARIDGGQLAALMAVNAFLGVAPVVLVVFGLFGDTTPAAAFADGVVRNWGVTDDAAEAVRAAAAGASRSPLGATVVAAVSFGWFGLALGDTVRIAFRRAWGEPADRIRGDWVRVTAWYLVVLTLVVGGWSSASLFDDLPTWGEVVAAVGTLALMTGFWLATPRLFLHTASGAPPSWRRLAPGALLCALGFVVAQALASELLTPWVTEYVGLFGAVGVAFTVLFWWWVIAYLVLAGAVVGAVVDDSRHVTGAPSTGRG